MKKILTKLSYMAFGSLLMLIGYHFGNIDNNSADAQGIVKENAPIVRELRCRSLVIVDDDNTPRITLGTNQFGHGEIQIYNEKGTRRIFLGMPTFYDRGAVLADDNGVLKIFGDDNTPRITLGTNSIDRGEIQIYNEKGTRRIFLGVASDYDGGVLQITGIRNGGVAFGLGADQNGGYMALWNKVLDKPVLQASVTQKGAGAIITWDNTGNQIGGMGPLGTFITKEKSRK